MPPDSNDEREIRAARNQATFRAVNERLVELNEALGGLTGKFVIACECADTRCVATLEIPPDDYTAMRREPNRFAVLPGHVYLDVERVVGEHDGFVVVEKAGAGAEVAKELKF